MPLVDLLLVVTVFSHISCQWLITWRLNEAKVLMRMQGKEGYDEHYATMATHNYYGLEGAARLREYQIIFDGMWVTLLFLRIVFYRRPITPMIT